MARIKDWMEDLKMLSMMECPDCEGDGVVAVEIAKPQSFSRDIGEIYEEIRNCELCSGSGEVERDDEDF